MSILYCAIPHFPAALARRCRPDLRDRALVLIDPEGRVFSASAEAESFGITAGLTARAAQVRCPQAHLLDADVPRCRQTFEALLQVLERTGPKVEPYGWGEAYVDLGNLARTHPDAIALCREIGRAIRGELGDALQPALGWDRCKFTAQAAARRTQPGHLLAISAPREQNFLNPLPVTLLPLGGDTLQRLRFLGLRTLGQYAALPPAAVWQQFGRAGKLAHRCAQGKDERPVISRWQAPRLQAEREFEDSLSDREQLASALERLVRPILAELRGNLRACGQARLTVRFEDGSTQERTRTFLYPTAEENLVTQALEQLLVKMHWSAPATTLAVVLEQIQDAVVEQLTLFPADNERERKLQQVQHYLAARFGPNRLRRAAVLKPNAPLPEWRIGWDDGEGP